MEPEELGKVRPTTVFSSREPPRGFPDLLALRLRIGLNIHGLIAGRLRLSAPKVKVKMQSSLCLCVVLLLSLKPCM